MQLSHCVKLVELTFKCRLGPSSTPSIWNITLSFCSKFQHHILFKVQKCLKYKFPWSLRSKFLCLIWRNLTESGLKVVSVFWEVPCYIVRLKMYQKDKKKVKFKKMCSIFRLFFSQSTPLNVISYTWVNPVSCMSQFSFWLISQVVIQN